MLRLGIVVPALNVSEGVGMPRAGALCIARSIQARQFLRLPSMHSATAESGGVGAATASADGGGGVITGRGAGAPCARAALGAVIITNSAAMATPMGARLVMDSPSG